MADTCTTRADYPSVDPVAVAAADPTQSTPQKLPQTPPSAALSDTAHAVHPPPPPLPAAKKRRHRRRNAFGSTVAQQIMRAVAATKRRRGLSVAAMKKMLSANGYDVAKNNSRVNQTVKGLVSKGSLVRITGIGAAGSFRLSNSQAGPPAGGEAPSVRDTEEKRGGGGGGGQQQQLLKQQHKQQSLKTGGGEKRKVSKRRRRDPATERFPSARKGGVKKLFRGRGHGQVGRPKKAVTRALKRWRLMKVKRAKPQAATKHLFGRN